MSRETSKHVRTITKRGALLCVPIPKEIEVRLGWNLYDHVTYDVQDGSLIVTKVKLPTVEHLRARSGVVHMTSCQKVINPALDCNCGRD